MELKILQWNIGTPLYGFRREGVQLFPYSIFHKRRIKFIEKTIKYLDPDVLCLQEYLPGEIDLSKYPYVLKIPAEHYPVLQVALFSKIPITSSYLDPKGAFILGNIEGLNIISTYLNIFNSTWRLQQVNRIIDLYEPDQKYIITGDFNMHRIFRKFFHKNDFLSHNKILNNLDYKPKNLLGSYMYTLEELDYFYYSKDIEIKKIKTIYNFLKIFLAGMDHFPTFINIQT